MPPSPKPHSPPDATRIPVSVKPRSSRTRLLGRAPDGTFIISLAAPPTDGDANRELLRYLASLLEIPRTALHISHGAASRKKLVCAPTLPLDTALARLTAHLPPS